jgi:hypothetical protein
MLMTFHHVQDKGVVSAARLLIALWLASGQRADPVVLGGEYEACLRFATYGFDETDDQTRRAFRDLVVHQLKYDRWRLPKGWIQSTADAIEGDPDSPVITADARAFIRELRQIRD